ncbi:MAG: TonB family protein [Nitrospirales bacterium]
MTSTFPEQPSDTQTFVLSALGSMALHSLLVIGLTFMPPVTIVKEEPPTVQVTFLPSPEVTQTPPDPTPPSQPQTFTPKPAPPPMPQATANRSQPPVPLLPSAPAPLTAIKPSPLAAPEHVNPILNDTRASQAMKVRGLMKMRAPSHAPHAASTLPPVTTRRHSENRALPPMPTARKAPHETPSLPAPPMLTTPRTLTAAPPARPGPTMTRPTIISSTRPVYPRVARESGWEGTVIVRTLVDTNGVPSQVKIRQSCGHPTLDEAAQDAVKGWTFDPAKDGNIPITKWVDIPIKFDLNR